MAQVKQHYAFALHSAGDRGHPNDPCSVSDDLHALTTQERAWIQTFPKDFKWVGSKTDIEQMVGNAVPVNLAKYVAETIKIVLGGDSNG